MSAFNYLRFAAAVPLVAVLMGFAYEVVGPGVTLMQRYSSSQASATGISWYSTYMNTLLPFIALALLGFAALVYTITRKRMVGP